jgi:cation diffusion facilitator family transporter
MERPDLRRFAWLSIAAAVLTIGLKSAAYLMTGSVGLLSDALESGVNLAAALMALAMLTLAARPADEEHAFGHTKAEYFSSVVEGVMIVVAAGGILWAAVPRLIDPQPIEQTGAGLAVSTVAAGINFAVATVLFRAGKRYHSLTLEADAHHLMTDVWTSGGVLIGVGLMALTGWLILDPLIAIAVALNIIYAGYQLILRSTSGLLDSAIDPTEQRLITAIFADVQQSEPDIAFHAVRTRQAGAVRFISFHLLVPGDWSVQRSHDLCTAVEQQLRSQIPHCSVMTHIEPREDPRSFENDLAEAIVDRPDTR